MMKRLTGTTRTTTVAGETVEAFIPFDLPPRDPPLYLDPELAELLRQSVVSLERLALASELVPSIDWFIYGFVRKEAVVSSQIEGTQATLADLLDFEALEDQNPAPGPDVEEVCNYLDALGYARAQLGSPDGLPISMRLLNGCHRRLMDGTRGSSKQPGEIRRSQNWIGGSRPGNAVFVPAPPDALAAALSGLERTIHDDGDFPPLIRIGLLHVQFETIHPYLDGNGRIGRLLIALLLGHWDLLPQPMLYVSLYFKRHLDEYYQRLGAVRTDGDWEGWLSFFLEAVTTISEEAVESAREISKLVREDRVRVLAGSGSSLAAARLFELLPSHPVLTIRRATRILDTTKPTATKAMNALVDAGILTETSGRKRDRRFAYSNYLELLGSGTEL